MGLWKACQELKLQPLGFQAAFLPSDDKAGFRHYVERRTTECAVEGLNGSCGHAKVGPGQPSDAQSSFLLSLTGPQSFSFSFTTCLYPHPALLTHSWPSWHNASQLNPVYEVPLTAFFLSQILQWKQ